MDKAIEKMAEWEHQNEEYQGIAKPVYDILSDHIPAGGKSKDGVIILHGDHHAIAFEVQRELRKLGYRLPLELKLISDEEIYKMHKSWELIDCLDEEQGRIVATERLRELAQAQLDSCNKQLREEKDEHRRL